MKIAILTFDGFNEIDSFVALAMLNRMKPQGWQAFITSPTETLTSMNGVTIERQKPLSSSPTDSKGPAGKGAAPGAPGGEARSRIETEMKESAEERRARRVKEIIAEKTQKKAAAPPAAAASGGGDVDEHRRTNAHE